MLLSDLINVFQWWVTIFFIGIIFTPTTNLIFPNFLDKGYIFAKVIGIALISYTVFILGFLKILPFETQNIFLIVGIFVLINLFILKKIPLSNIKLKSVLPIFVLEEFAFILILMFWSFIHAHQPEIHGLEKYMDFGFINSILRSEYFPPKDMWFTPFYINYYYFGHLVTAVLTKLSILPSFITYNLMLSTISGITFVGAFSIGVNLVKNPKLILGGFLSGLIITFAGNLHSIYLFFKPYENENPVPFWQLLFSPNTFPNGYWYPNATRFIENTIHEFPLYSFVVSDLHGHVLDIPFVLLTIAILLSLFFKSKLKIINLKFEIPLISFLLAVMYMTNAWDGIIYFLLSAIIIAYIKFKTITNSSRQSIKYYVSSIKNSSYLIPTTLYLILTLVGFFIFTLPFNINFKPFASGIGVLCAPKFLTDIGNFGPFLFEVNHCQHSPLWQLGILYGFFYFFVFSFILFLKLNSKRYTLNASDIFVGILIILSTLLIIIPEFIYVKDIYPAHYRANTMFKLVYQSFIMLSLSCGYIIIRILKIKYKISNIFNFKYLFLIFAFLFLIPVFLYPYYAIKSYFGNLKIYSGLNGTSYLKTLYSDDYEAISWINKNIKNQPVILEAQGDSYTDYGRVSTNTGLPTVLGWTVHEWLWRGSYDIPSPRISEVQKLYESNIDNASEEFYIVKSGDYLIKIAAEIKFGDWRRLFDLNKEIIDNPSLIYPNQKLRVTESTINNADKFNLEEIKNLIKKYNISYVYIGGLEREKYPNLDEEKFLSLGKIIFQKGGTKIFRVSK